MRHELEIVFVLPGHYSPAIQRAAADQRIDTNDIAREATMEWLDDNGYLQQTTH